jgi:hypothetical protein
MSKKNRYFKVLRRNASAPITSFQYTRYLPHKDANGNWVPGRWLPDIHEPPYSRNLRMCHHGYHVCRADAIKIWWDSYHRLFEVEVKGRGLHKEDKSCFSSIRLLREIPITSAKIAGIRRKSNYLFQKYRVGYDSLRKYLEPYCLEVIDKLCNLSPR